MAKKTGLNDLRDHLFEVIERLKLSNDPDASEKEKISIDTAKQISDTAKVIVDSAKVEADVIRTFANAQNPKLMESILQKTEFLRIEGKKEDS